MNEQEKERQFSALIDQKLPMLRRVVYRIVRDEHDTDDVIQNALLKAWEKFESFGGQSQLSSWVCRIACNQAYDLFRRRQREALRFEPQQLEQLEVPASPQQSSSAEELQRINAAMDGLPPKYHAALNLTALEEIPPQEAAKMLGCTTATLYWRIHKARKLLKKHLGKEVNK